MMYKIKDIIYKFWTFFERIFPPTKEEKILKEEFDIDSHGGCRRKQGTLKDNPKFDNTYDKLFIKTPPTFGEGLTEAEYLSGSWSNKQRLDEAISLIDNLTFTSKDDELVDRLVNAEIDKMGDSKPLTRRIRNGVSYEEIESWKLELLKMIAELDLLLIIDWTEELDFYLNINDMFVPGADAYDIVEEDLPIIRQVCVRGDKDFSDKFMRAKGLLK